MQDLKGTNLGLGVLSLVGSLDLMMNLTDYGEFECDKDALIYKYKSYTDKKKYLETSEQSFEFE